MKRAYSRLERDDSGVIRVVFYDADTSLPVADLSGYSIVAIDNKGQAVPVNSVQPASTQPVETASLPPVQNPPAGPDGPQRSVPDVFPRPGANGGAVSGMDLEPTGRFVGPNGLMGLALGDKNIDGNKGWKNKVLNSAIGLAAGAAIGGPVGLAAGVVAKGIVGSDSFKNRFNSRGQLSPIGVGIGEPDVPAGAPTGEVGFGVTPTSRPTPTAQPQTVSIGPSQQASSIPSIGDPQAQAQNVSLGVNTAAPSMSAFNRRENISTPEQSKGYRQGLSPEIDAVAGMMETEFGRTLNSGYRDPGRNARVGGAKNSEHTRGNAIDVDVSGMTNEEKRSMLEAAVQNGVRGVGIYNSGRSIHLDTRQNPTSWGPRGFAGSPVSEMPDWSQNTLSAMYGAGPGGRVLPDKGPTPVSRDKALANMPTKSRVQEDDLAFTSRPNFKDMTVGKIAATGFGTVPDNNTLNAMSYTLAGELTDFSPKSVANVAATLHNRISSVGPEKTFTPSQYNSLMPEKRAVTDANYKKHGYAIKSALENFYAGQNTPVNPDATHYYNPSISNPAWGGQLKNDFVDEGHRIGTIPGEYKASTAAQQAEARRADDNFTSRSLASQVGRNVENEDKNLGNSPRGFGYNSKYDGNKSSSSSKSNNSGISSRKGSGKEKDDRGVGLGSRSSSSSKSSTSKSSTRSNNSGISSRSGSGKDKDDRGVGLGSKSSSSKSSPSKSTGGGNSSVSGRSGSGKDKDDKGVGSSSSGKSSSSGGKKSGGNATW